MDNKRRPTILANGTLLNVMCQPEWEGGLERMDTYTCMAESLGCLPENGAILLIGYAPIQNALVLKKKGGGEAMWSWIQLEFSLLREVRKKKRQISYGITYMWNLKYDTNESIKQK